MMSVGEPENLASFRQWMAAYEVNSGKRLTTTSWKYEYSACSIIVL
jgi:hypothetical protein